MSQIKLTIAVSENMKNDLISEAKTNNMTLSELCRAKLSQEYKTERMTNNQIFKLTDKCYRLIMSQMLIKHGRDANIRNVSDLNEDEISTLASDFNNTVSEILPNFVAS